MHDRAAAALSVLQMLSWWRWRMTVPALPADGVRSVLDSEILLPGERFEAWADAVSRSFVPLAARPRPGSVADFRGSLVSQSLAQADISTVSGAGMSVRRTSRSIALSDPGYIKVGLQVRGYCVISQDDRDAALAPGDFAIYDTTRPYVLEFDDTFEMFVVMLPAERLRIHRDVLATLTASRFSGRRGLGAVTSSFLTEVSRQLDSTPLTGGPAFGDAVVDLLTATLMDRLGEVDGPPDASRRTALLLSVKSHIVEHLGDRSLTVADVAAAHHVSVRFLQKLFEEHGETMSAWTRERRLEQCRRDLSDPALHHRPVAAIGARWGFGDAAAFSRSFRSHFGVSPRELRSGAPVKLLDHHESA